MADSDTDFLQANWPIPIPISDFFFFKQQTRKNESIHKQDVCLVINQILRNLSAIRAQNRMR